MVVPVDKWSCEEIHIPRYRMCKYTLKPSLIYAFYCKLFHLKYKYVGCNASQLKPVKTMCCHEFYSFNALILSTFVLVKMEAIGNFNYRQLQTSKIVFLKFQANTISFASFRKSKFIVSNL